MQIELVSQILPRIITIADVRNPEQLRQNLSYEIIIGSTDAVIYTRPDWQKEHKERVRKVLRLQEASREMIACLEDLGVICVGGVAWNFERTKVVTKAAGEAVSNILSLLETETVKRKRGGPKGTRRSFSDGSWQRFTLFLLYDNARRRDFFQRCGQPLSFRPYGPSENFHDFHAFESCAIGLNEEDLNQ
jgi:hypothetical protein